MKHRNPIGVIVLTLITLGIYGIVWQVKTKNEMNKLGANIPTAWLIIIPFVNLYWLWKYAQGVEQVTGGKQSTVLVFVLMWILGIVGMAIVQNEFNQLGQTAAPGPQPDGSFGAPVMADPTAPAPVVPTTPAAPTDPSVIAPQQPAPPVAAAPEAPVSDPAQPPSQPVV